MGDTSHGMMSRSLFAGSPRKNNSEEVARRRAELQHQLEQRREEARRQQEQKMAKAAAQKEERLARHREIQQREMLRAKAVLDRRAQVLAEAEEKKAAVLAKAHATASRLNQQKTRPVFAFGSSTPRELGYLTQLTKEQKVYDRKLQPISSPPQSTISAGHLSSTQAVAASGRAQALAASCAMTRSLYVTHSEPKTRPKLSPTVMTQSMVASRKGPLNRSNRSPPMAPSTAQRAAAQRHIKTVPPSNVARSGLPSKTPNPPASRKSPVPTAHHQKATSVHIKTTLEQPKNAEYKAKIQVQTKSSDLVVTNDSVHCEVRPVGEEKLEGADDKQAVEVVHDSPSTENTHVNKVVQDTVVDGDSNGKLMVDDNEFEVEQPSEDMRGNQHGDMWKEGTQQQELQVEPSVAVDIKNEHSDEGQEDGKMEGALDERNDQEEKEIVEGKEEFKHNQIAGENTDDHSAAEFVAVEGQTDVIEELSTHVPTEAVDNKRAEVEEVAQEHPESEDEDTNMAQTAEEHKIQPQRMAVEVPHFELEPELANDEPTEPGMHLVEQQQSERGKLADESQASGSDTERTTSNVLEGKFGGPEGQQTDEERFLAQERLRALQLRAEQEQLAREQRKARLAAIMSRTRGTPTAVVAPTQNIITDESGVNEPLEDVKHAPTPNDSAAPRILSHTAASVLQKLASSNPRLLSVLQRNGSNPSLADELTAADPSMTLPGQPDEPPPSRDGTATAPLRSLDFHADVNHTTLAMK